VVLLCAHQGLKIKGEGIRIVSFDMHLLIDGYVEEWLYDFFTGGVKRRRRRREEGFWERPKNNQRRG